MKYVAMDGKLNDHCVYVAWINELEKVTKYIEIVTPYRDGSDDELLVKIQDWILETGQVSEWWGTRTVEKSSSWFRIKADRKVFDQLRKYQTFCVLTAYSEYGDFVEQTDFKDKDIAFFDEKKEPLFFTTTHEGYLQLRNDSRYLLKQIENE